MFVFFPIITYFENKFKKHSDKKSNKYIDKKKAKLCIAIIVAGILIMVLAAILFLYSTILLHSILNLIGWGVGIFAFFGLVLMILGIKMGLQGALDEFEEFVNELIERKEEEKED